jgi:hypothetical protein
MFNKAWRDQIFTLGLKFSPQTQTFFFTGTETSHHIQRLSDAKLIFKDSESLYKVTPYGKLILSLLPSLGFVSIPYEWINDLFLFAR